MKASRILRTWQGKVSTGFDEFISWGSILFSHVTMHSPHCDCSAIVYHGLEGAASPGTLPDFGIGQ